LDTDASLTLPQSNPEETHLLVSPTTVVVLYRDEKVRSRNQEDQPFPTALGGLLSPGAGLNDLSPLRLWVGRLFSLEFCGHAKLNYAGHLSLLLRLEGALQLPIEKSKSGLPRAAFLERPQAASRSPDHGCHQSDSVSTLRRQTTSSGMPKQTDGCPVVSLNRSAMTRKPVLPDPEPKREIECRARSGEQIANALTGDTSSTRRA
jgi:hypothetical protein